MGIASYSTTPASNTSISGINIAEGCPPSGVNDAIRQMMADIASDVAAVIRAPQMPSATGTANAVVVALSPAITVYSAGQSFEFLPTAPNTGATTINYGGGVINLQKRGGLALAPNDLLTGVAAMVEYDGTRAVLLNPQQYTQGADIASAATLNLDNATGDYVTITGTTGVTAITLAQGRQVSTRFSGVLTITNGASLVLHGGGNFTTQANDVLTWRGEASGVVRLIGVQRASGQTTSMTGTEATLASAATTDLGGTGVNLVSVTGTTTITSLGSSASTVNPLYFVRFTGALTLTHNGTSLILPTSANITTVAGDSAVFKYEGSGNWRCISYARASGASVASSTSIVRGHISGFVASALAGTSTTATASISAGQATDSGNTVTMSGSALSFAVSNGNAANGYQGGTTLPNNSVIHLYAIATNADTTWSACFASTSLAPTLPGAYTKYRRVDSFLTNGSGAPLPYSTTEVLGGGVQHYTNTLILDINTTTLSTTRTLFTLPVPTGIQVWVILRAACGVNPSFLNITSPDEPDGTVSNTALALYDGVNEGAGAPTHVPHVLTNTSGQVYAKANTTTTLRATTRGWIDFRS